MNPPSRHGRFGATSPLSSRHGRFGAACLLLAAFLAAGWPSAAAAQTHDHSTMTPPAGEQPAPPQPAEPQPEHAQSQASADVEGHAVHDNAVNYYVLFDRLEWQGDGDGGIDWDTKGWIGRDLDRLWFRSELQRADGRVEDAEAHLLYGRAVARWWDVVAGVRQDFGPGPARTWAAIGLQGLAPYWFQIEATAYVGAGGRTAARFETEYELLVTNRLILQPLLEANVYGKADPERAIGAGLGTLELGLRARYEIRREIAPYVGVTWERKFGRTADFADAAGEPASHARFAIGARVWF